MNLKDVELLVVKQADRIAKAISNGKDVEIVKTSSGIAIKEVSKKKIT